MQANIKITKKQIKRITEWTTKGNDIWLNKKHSLTIFTQIKTISIFYALNDVLVY